MQQNKTIFYLSSASAIEMVTMRALLYQYWNEVGLTRNVMMDKVILREVWRLVELNFNSFYR